MSINECNRLLGIYSSNEDNQENFFNYEIIKKKFAPRN